jgi:site-specific DNA recombinase
MASNLEELVWDHVGELLSDRDLLEARYQEGRGDPAVSAGEEQERERIGRKLAAQEREVQRLVDAHQAEVIELAELRDRRQRIEEHGRVLTDRLREIERQRHDRENEIRLLQGTGAFCDSVAHALAEPAPDLKQKVLQLVVDRVIVEDAGVVVRHIVPTGPVSLQTGQNGITVGIMAAGDRCQRDPSAPNSGANHHTPSSTSNHVLSYHQN